MIIISIIVTYFTAGAASGFVASAANAGAGSAFAAGAAATAATATTAATQAVAAGWANAALTAMLTSAASTATVSTINNKGNLGAAVKETFSAESMKNYIVAGAVAGLTTGLFNDWTSTTTESGTALTDSTSGALANTGKVAVSNSGGLSSLEGIAQFTANQALQNSTSAVLNKALGRDGSLGDAFQSSLVNAFAAYGFNLVGDIGKDNHLSDGGIAKIGLHAVMGGLASLAAGGDFKTGALAAGVNEAFVNDLASVYAGMPTEDRDRLLLMNSQLIGVLTTAAQDPDADTDKLQTGAWVAQNGTQYNRQLHKEDRELAEQLAARSGGKYTVEQIEAQLRLSSVNGTDNTGATDIVASGAGIYDTGGNWIALGDGQYVQNFESANREIIAYIKENTNVYSWSLTAQTGFNSVNDKSDWPKTTSGLRDRLTGYSIDENGGYRVPIAIDGVAYTPRYLPCGNAECLATGANIDFADAGTLKWLRAANAKAINDVGWLMGVAAIPASGTSAAILSNGSTAASLLSGYLKNELVSGLASSALSASFEKYAVASGVSEKVASQLSNGFGAAGVWDAINEKAVEIFKGK